MEFVVLMILALLATGVVAGLMAGLLGVGGGLVIVPVLYYLFGALEIDEAVKMHVAVGTSLATIIVTSIRSARAHHGRGNLDEGILRGLIPGVVLGVLVGSVTSAFVSGATLQIVFGSIALLVSLNMARTTPWFTLGSLFPAGNVRHAIGSVVGFFSTLMGIGGATMSVPVMSAYQVPMHRAVGTSAAIGLVIAVPGTIGFIISGLSVPNRPPFSLGYVNLAGFALIVPMTILLAPVGAALAQRLSTVWLRRVFAVFLAFTSVRMFASVILG